MLTSRSRTELELLLKVIDDAYDRRAWHGTNLRGSIRGLSAEEAAWRPATGRHNIWEIIVHAAYWKYAVRRRLLGEKRGSFPLKGSNWFAKPAGRSKNEWRKDVELLDTMHRELRQAINSMLAADLVKTSGSGRFTNREMIYGIALHDVYHAGQIQLIKRLLKKL
jgi:uncharacterized damage-inducible protein DinB